MIGTVLSGRYHLESKLGSGGMSTVYLTRDETLERWVAVKVLHREISDDPAQIERFRREARAVAQLSHPNVVAVIDAGEDGGHPYIVFEYVEGETLKQRIERLGKLPLDEAAAYAIEVGRGLAAAHAGGIVHRDIKPQNVLIDPEGRAKVTDFGIARTLDAQGLTATGRVLGTTDYVSPEQAMGHPVDARSDLYSLGVVLYEMLTGRPPFAAESLVGVAMKHVNEAMPNVQVRRPETSSALAAVVERATAKEPGKRYPEIGAMLDELETALEVEVARGGGPHGEATAVLDSVPERERRLLTRSRASKAGGAAVILGLAAALGIAALTGEEGPSHEAVAGGEPIEVAEAAAFDPVSDGGDGQEHSTEVRLSIDGDPTTAWPTETYQLTSPELAPIKPGVGIYVDAGEESAARAMEVRSLVGGWSAVVYGAASGPPTDLSGWGEPIGEVQAASEEQTIILDATRASRYYLLWFTSLAGEQGEYRVEVGDIRLIG